MFESHVTWFGFPPGYVVIAVGLVGALIGLLWMRQIVSGEPETESFLATARRHTGPSAVKIFATALLGLALILAGLLVYGTGGPGDSLLIGVLLEGAALALVLRRVLAR